MKNQNFSFIICVLVLAGLILFGALSAGCSGSYKVGDTKMEWTCKQKNVKKPY